MNWRLLAFRAAAWPARGLQRLTRIAEHVAVATLTREQLIASAGRHWEHFNRLPIALGSELFDWERSLLDPLLAGRKRVLVVGCGSGREVMALLARGHRVDGLDIAPRAVQRARERVDAAGHTSHLVVAALEDRPALPGPYDLILFSWYCYSYIPDSRFRHRALQAAVELLGPGGRVVLSYMPERAPTTKLARVARLVAWLLRSGWRPERGDGLLVSGEAGLVSFQHWFRPGDVVDEVMAAGLHPVSHELHEVGGLLVAARRPAESVSGATPPVDSAGLAP